MPIGRGSEDSGTGVLVAGTGRLADFNPRSDYMAAILFVRVKSQLEESELERRAIERRPRFRDVPGLIQKIYGRDESTGDVCGIYFFEDHAALSAFRESELAQTIPTAYEAIEVRREVYDVLYPLHPERGPLSE